MTLEKEDLILTGTPSGVGPVQPRNLLVGQLLNPNGKVKSSIAFPVKSRTEE